MIDTSQWKEFRFSDIFDVRRGERILKDIDYLKKPDENNCFPVITAKTVNNGIDGYYDKVNCTGNCLVACGEASGMFTTYQSEECWCLDTVRIITLKSELISMTPNIGLFLATILSNNMYRFSYGRKAKPDNMNTLDLLLPATATGEPDWQFMEEFMGGLHARPLTTSVQSSHIPLNTEEWGEFRIGDIFSVKGGFFNKKPEHSIDGDIPFLAATEKENGVTEFYSDEDIASWNKIGEPDDTLQEKMFPASAVAVTVNGSCCDAFFQQTPYTCSHDITSIRPLDGHEMSPLEGLFICVVIHQEKFRWSYGRKPHDVKKFSNMIIKLPATATGEPDWQWMENYMKSLPFSDKIK